MNRFLVKLSVGAICLCTLPGLQSSPLAEVPLNGLSVFSAEADNWTIVGDVAVDTSEVRSMSGLPGTGVLLNLPDKDKNRSHLYTKFEHGDIELEVEVMVPVKSNSGLYFQGRYEIQVLDSWGVETPRHADIGGIYHRWDPTKEQGKRGYEGHPPSEVVAKRPGEWQQFRIVFRAPRFNENGQKIRNARFEAVWLNGKQIHQKVEVTGPTRSAAFDDEAAWGPLMVQGDHGPVALRNLKYRLLENSDTEARFDPTWESLERYETPEWFRDAKFGIYVHWGIYSVPERGEWYGRWMYMEGRNHYRYHLENFGHPSEFGYKDFIPMWKAERFDADAWLALFKEAGARYFTPCAVHHDGFDLWDSKRNPYNAVRMGPKRDLIGALKEATQKAGLRWGVTTHVARAYNWMQYSHLSDEEGPYKGIPYDGANPEYEGFYHKAHGNFEQWYPKDSSPEWKGDWLDRLTDLVDNYELDFLYFDGAIPFSDDDALAGRTLLSHFYNENMKRNEGRMEGLMAIKHKEMETTVYRKKDYTGRDHGIYRPGVATLDLENVKFDALKKDPWQTDDSIGPWGYNSNPNSKYKSVDYIVDKLVDIVSKNGNLLLNVPPRADGSLDDETVAILKGLGAWMKTNGKSIYETRPWVMFEQGDLRFARSKSGDTLYATLLEWPGSGSITIEALTRKGGHGLVKSISFLGSNDRVNWSQNENGLTTHLPDTPFGEHAHVIEITFK